YSHELELAPAGEMLHAFKKGHWSWAQYETEYLDLMRSRALDENLTRAELSDAVLLCSEATPEHCHRRLAAEYLAKAWGDIEIVHL
ncbi:MAG: DUF488 domain-containing protein, partial [Microbacteriaceae bacterium]|nr:DUF488 domain-containing protein [Microbacteriaceae bacterium]